jgi:hypothetical protein
MKNYLSTNKSQLLIEWILRVLISALFLISVIGKLYPAPSVYTTLSAFEAKQLVPMGFNGGFAQWFSRTLIGCELALSILILQRHYYKKLILPFSIVMLLVFSVHLTFEIISNGNVGNCGCFGEFLPMSPLAAIIKNVIAIGFLVYLFKMRISNTDLTNLYVLTTVVFGSVMLVFMIGMKKSTLGEFSIPTVSRGASVIADSAQLQNIAMDTVIDKKTMTTSKTNKDQNNIGVSNKEKKEEPKSLKSGFQPLYNDIDNGRKVLCFFVPGCDHCQETAKELTALSKQIADFPEVKIIFLDEETELIPNFFTMAGKAYPYRILDPGAFYTLLGTANIPMVNYLWNGNKVKVYEGTENNAFKKNEFKSIVQKSWKELGLD